MNKLIRSSANPEQVSLTIKGAVVLLAIAILPKLGIDLSANDITLLIESLIIIVASTTTALGICRKVYIALKK